MRSAAMVLGTIGGLLMLVVGFVAFGYTEVIYRWGEVPNWMELPENVDALRGASLLAPVLAIAGAAMARHRALLGGVLLLISAGGLYWAFGFGLFTMFPIAMCGLAGVLAVTAGRPDQPVRHF